MSEHSQWLFRITDMLERIERIQSHIKDCDFETFRKTPLIIDAVERSIEVIGEAAKGVPEDVCQENPDIPWVEIKGIRNKLAHDYSGINMQVVWNVAKEELPNLKKSLSRMIEKYRE